MTKHGKKLFLILTFLFFVIFLVSCDDERKTYALNLPNEISASLDDLTNIQDGTEVMLTVAVPEGKEIDKLVVNGEEVVVTNNTYKFKITKDTTITVTFKDPEPEPVYYKLTLPGGVTANVSDLNNVLENTEVILTVAVPAEKEIAELTVNGVKVSVAENKYTFAITKDTVVTVSFKDSKPPVVNYKLTLPADVTANVSDLNQIAENSEVTLTIDVPTGKLLDYLKVNGQTVTVTGNTYLFVISKNTAVEVAFKDPAPTDEFVKLTLPSGVTANVSNLDEVLKDSNVTLTINVPAGKLLDYLKVNEQAVTVVGNTYLFVISKDTNVEVAFKDPAPTDEFVKLTLPSGVTANVANSDEVLKGSDVTLTINVRSGKLLDSLVVDGHQVAVTGNTYTFTILKDLAVSVSFKDPAPTDVFFKLTLPSGVTANVTNLNEILEGTAITLTIAAPTDYRLDFLRVNAELVNVVNNSYTFTITQNTVVEVEFKYDDGWEEALFSEVVEFLNQLSGEFFQPGTLGFELNLNADETKMFAEALILFDQDLNVAEAAINYDIFYEEELQERLGIYNDGLYLYYLEEAFGEDIEDGEESMVMVLNINAQLLETIVPLALMTFLGEEIDFMPGGPHSINEFLNQVIGLGSGFITEDLELLKLFEFSKKDDFLKLTLNFDDQTIFDLIEEILLEELFADFDPEELELEIDGELQFNFELIFANHKFHSINLNLFLEDEENQLQIDAFFGYTTKTIEAPFDLTKFDVSELESITYYFHLGEDKIEEFIVQKDLVENLLEEIDDPEIIEMMISYLSPYQKGYHPTGFYLDTDFTTPLSGDDLLTDNLAVYVEWEEDLTYEELLALLIEDGVLYLSYDDYENMTYYEDDTVIVYYYEYGDFIYWRKDTNIAYFVEMNGGLQLYQLAADFPLFNPLLAILSEADESALIEYRGAYFNLDAGFVLTKERVVLLLDDEYFYPAFYLKGELDEVALNTLVHLEAAIDEALEPPDEFFKLTLPSGVTADVSNLNEILKDTLVTLTVILPTGYVLESLKVNDEVVVVTNNKYSFTITRNSVVEVEFKYDDSWEEALFSEVVEFLSQLSGEFFQPGTLGFELYFNEDDLKIFAEVLILFDNDLNVAKAVINYNGIYEEGLQGQLNIYNDGQYLYYLEKAFGEEAEEESMVMVLNINAQLLETIVPFVVFFASGEEIDFLPGGPHSINELLEKVVALGTGFITEDLEILRLFEFSKKDDLLRLSLNLDNETIIDLIQEFGELLAEFEIDELEVDLEVNFEIIFANHKFKSISLNVSIEDEEEQISISGFFGYTEKVIEAPFDLTQFDVSEIESITYYFHLDADKTEEFIIQKDFIEEFLVDIPEESHEMLIAYLKPYKKGYHAVGLYLDADFTTPLSGEDFLTDKLNVYVEWKKDLTYEELVTNLLEDGVLFLTYDEDVLTYYEDDTVIVYYYKHGDFIYWRKDTNIAYSVEMNGGFQLYQLDADFPLFSPLLAIISEADESTLLEYRGAYINLDAGFVLAKERVVLLLDDEYFCPGFYLKDELNENVRSMIAALEAAIDEAS